VIGFGRVVQSLVENNRVNALLKDVRRRAE
jgi:hypothetical protein